MAWIEWVSQNVSSNTDVNTANTAVNGFQSNTIASSKQVNTILRQSSIITKALMNALGVDGDYTSLVGDATSGLVKDINDALANKIRYEHNIVIRFIPTSGDESDISFKLRTLSSTSINSIQELISQWNNSGYLSTDKIPASGQLGYSGGKAIYYVTNPYSSEIEPVSYVINIGYCGSAGAFQLNSGNGNFYVSDKVV